jgi:hypothetical protein
METDYTAVTVDELKVRIWRIDGMILTQEN